MFTFCVACVGVIEHFCGVVLLPQCMSCVCFLLSLHTCTYCMYIVTVYAGCNACIAYICECMALL